MVSRKRVKQFVMGLSVFGLLWALESAGLACPTCKESLAANDPHHQNLVAGYYYSILFMMSMPFVLLTSFSSYMYLEVRRARAAEAAKKSQPSDHHA